MTHSHEEKFTFRVDRYFDSLLTYACRTFDGITADAVLCKKQRAAEELAQAFTDAGILDIKDDELLTNNFEWCAQWSPVSEVMQVFQKWLGKPILWGAWNDLLHLTVIDAALGCPMCGTSNREEVDAANGVDDEDIPRTIVCECPYCGHTYEFDNREEYASAQNRIGIKETNNMLEICRY